MEIAVEVAEIKQEVEDAVTEKVEVDDVPEREDVVTEAEDVEEVEVDSVVDEEVQKVYCEVMSKYLTCVESFSGSSAASLCNTMGTWVSAGLG